MAPTRRTVMTGVGVTIVAALAGCSGDGGDQENGDDGTEGATPGDGPTATPEPETRVVVDQELHLSEESYESWQFYVDSEFQLEYEYTVTEGSAIDVFVVPHRELANYEKEVAFEWVSASQGEESDSVTVDLDVGTYHLIVDHTSLGDTEPPGGLGKDPVDVEIYAAYTKLG